MGCLAWSGISQSYMITHSGPFFSIHSWIIDWMEGRPVSSPKGDKEEKKWEKTVFQRRTRFLILSELKLINPETKSQPRNDGEESRDGAGGGEG